MFAALSVTDNLLLGAFPRLTFGRERGDVEGDLGRVFDLFPRLRERATQLAGTLSGGEQQMLAMGRALMLKSRCVAAGRAVDGTGSAAGEGSVPHHR